jgi:hypothetical protein
MHGTKILKFVFVCILLIFYNSVKHNGDVSPDSNIVLIINITADFILFKLTHALFLKHIHI